MKIDWHLTDTPDLQDIADGMADAAERNLGLPFALVMMARDRAGTDEELTRHAFLAELGNLVARWRAEGAANA